MSLFVRVASYRRRAAPGWWFMLLAGYALAGCPLVGAATLDNLQYPQPVPMAPPSVAGMLLRLFLSLAIVLGLILVLVKLLQKNNLLARQGSWAKVVDRVVIGPNKTLILAEIFGKVYVLSVTDHNISTLLNEQEIDLSQFSQVVADVERKRALPAYLGNNFLQVLESKLGDLKKSYRASGRGSS